MKKVLFLVTLFASVIFSVNTASAGETKYYGKCSVQVAEDSKGLGTVYIDDGGTEVEEVYGEPVDYNNVGGATLNMRIITTPADGYVLANFTDQNGQVYYYPEEAPGTDPYNIGVFCTSQNPEDPSVFILSAHFVKAGDAPKKELAEVLISAEQKYATFMPPVDAELPWDVAAYKVTGVKGDAIEVETLGGGLIEAFTPVLIENTSLFDTSVSVTYDPAQLPEELPSMTAGLLTGTLEEKEAPAGTYVLLTDAATPAGFYKVTEATPATVAPYGCYMTVEGENTPESYIFGASVGIRQILESEKTTIYDLDGRRLEKLQKGVNIVNGVKVIVK